MVGRRGNTSVERSPLFVIDASVVVKWFVQEEFREEALAVRRDYTEGTIDLASPVLIVYEVFNALRYHPTFANDIGTYADSLLDMQIDLRLPSRETNKLAAQLAMEEGISGYDAHYLSLAETLNTKVITADEKFAYGLSEARKADVILLKDYKRRGVGETS